MTGNDPAVVAEVQAVFAAYEEALAERDLSALAGFFDSAPDVTRFGIGDEQRGPDELARWRQGQPPLPAGRALHATVVQTFGSDFAVVSTRFSYPGRAFVGRQSQTWARRDGAWRIVHAHVSEIALGAP